MLIFSRGLGWPQPHMGDADSVPSLNKGTLQLWFYIQPSISNLTYLILLKAKLYHLVFFSHCGLANPLTQFILSFGQCALNTEHAKQQSMQIKLEINMHFAF